MTGRMRPRFTRRWVLLVALGEAAGFAVAAGAAILSIALRLDDVSRLVVLIAAGAVEGAALATGQYLAMARERPRPVPWIGATAAAASIAWLLGMLPSTIGMSIGSAGTIAIVAAGALVLLASIPLAQWIALRRPRSFRWVPVNMGAWAVGILWTFAPSPLVDEQSPLPLVATLYVIAGLLMAVTVAALTAPVARSLFGPADAVPSMPHTG